MMRLPYRCRACDAPTRHHDHHGPLCPWCHAHSSARLATFEMDEVALAALHNLATYPGEPRVGSNIPPRTLEGHRVW